ncbi:MAG: autotransporter domain-containing protein, partial [Proteobacteria bacterium]|nr:autotransporter domain-containing protein [Pseudomonadota bacterium]
MYKRALMLTAATVALLAGPAYAANTNKTQTTDADGPIDVTSGNTITIPSSSKPATVPAIEINSATASKNIVKIETGGSLTYQSTASATGIQADAGSTGEIILGGTMDLTGSGATKTGIVLGLTGSTTGVFTGTVDSVNNTLNPTGSTAIALQSGSLLKTQGDGSWSIFLPSGATVDGDILANGTINTLPTTANSTASTGVTSIELDGTTNGSLVVGGSVESFGRKAIGILTGGQINGSIQNYGTILTSGTQTTATTDKGNPVAQSALVVSNNITGGIYNAGPLSQSDGTTTANIATNGDLPALLITTGFESSASAAPITIGGFTESAGLTYSLFNRGTISSAAQNVNIDAATAVDIIGGSATNLITLSSGIYNSGTITAQASADANATTAPQVSALVIGNYTNIVAPAGGTYAITNSSNGAATGATTGVGKITASYSGATAGQAIAVSIANTGATVPSLLNQGFITASAITSDTTVKTLSAIGILDQSGTLLNIDNAGTISAQAYASVNGTVAQLDNRANYAQAINLGAASGNVSLTNSGTIIGDVVLGSFNDTVNVSGSTTQAATITGNMNFGGGNDTLLVGSHATVTGDILESAGGVVNITVQAGGTLTATNNGSTSGGRVLPAGTVANISVDNLDVQRGGILGLTLADGFNINRTGNSGPIVQATSTGVINLEAGSTLKMNFGGFISAPELSSGAAGQAQFIIFDTASGNLNIANPSQVQQALTNGIPFLFTGSVCAYGVTGFSGAYQCTGTNPQGSTHSDVILTLQPKSASDIGLTGYAAAMFAPANLALANDADLGAAVINAGAPVGTTSLDATTGQQVYQKIYANFAPDVSGSARAVAISLTDQASSIVGERQRKLRMYARQDGDITLWAQEFGQRLSVPNKIAAGGYNNSGFGIAMGADGGSISSGRYGGAFTFYAGDTSEKYPRESKTTSEWYMLTGYTDWRGKGLFFDSQVSIGYGHLDGRRTLIIDDLSGTQLIKRQAEGKRSSALAAGGFSTGFIFSSGGTVLMPQFSMDALTLREEGYTESGGGAGMDLHVQPYYANSVRAFLGADLRQDLKMGSFFLQPEVRAGYRYDLLSGQEKLKVNFAGDQSVSPTVAPGQPFTITGPDPAKGNLVFGAGLAVTTDAWSV